MTGREDEKRGTIPRYLGERSTGDTPTPPIDTIEQVLPFQGLDWGDFERLCYRLARLEGEPEHVQLFGVRGQSQSGIDIYSRLKPHSYATYQCKRYETLTARDIEKSVDLFLSGEWAPKSSKFVVCVSASATRTDVTRAIEVAASKLATARIGFEVWDAEQLSAKLKALPDLVLEFFGKPWHDRFATPPAESGAVVSQWDAGLRTSRPCMVNAASWRALGIAPTSLLTPDTNALPTFVPRTVFKTLIDRLNAALALRGPTVIVLQGQPASGKTRLAFEAIRQSCPQAWLIAPASAADAYRLFHPRVYENMRLDEGTPVVLWLDDLETFTRSAGAGLTAAHLDELRLESRSVVALCTIGGKGMDVNRDIVDDRALAEIVALGGTPITVERRLDANELSAFRETFRISAPAPVRETGLGPYLVGASGITELWRSGRHAGVKEVPGSIVAEGLCLLDGLLAFGAERGFGEWSFDDNDLESAWSILRGPDRGVHGPPDLEILSQAIQWCTTEVSAGHPVLRRDRQNRSWVLSEILVEHVREECLDNRDMVVAYERAAELSGDEAALRYDRDKGDEVGRQPFEAKALSRWLDLERWAMIARRLHRLDVELRIYERIVDANPCLTRVKLVT